MDQLNDSDTSSRGFIGLAVSLLSTEFEANLSSSIANSQLEFNLIKKSHDLIEKETNLTIGFLFENNR